MFLGRWLDVRSLRCSKCEITPSDHRCHITLFMTPSSYVSKSPLSLPFRDWRSFTHLTKRFTRLRIWLTFLLDLKRCDTSVNLPLTGHLFGLLRYRDVTVTSWLRDHFVSWNHLTFVPLGRSCVSTSSHTGSHFLPYAHSSHLKYVDHSPSVTSIQLFPRYQQ